MNSYGTTALRAVDLFRNGSARTPQDAWQMAADSVFAHSESSRKKSCPKNAFLGLCEEGVVSGIPAGNYTRSSDNKAYALRAAALLRSEPGLARGGERRLWERAVGKERKVHNSQMHVVLALFEHGLLGRA